MEPTKARAPGEGAKEKSWEERWDAVLEEIRRGVPPEVTDDGLARDIDEAIEEVRRACRTKRRPRSHKDAA